MKVDRCGICGGDNSTCHTKKISNTFNNVVYGYNIVHKFPVGARDIKVKQKGYMNLKEDETYLGNFIYSLWDIVTFYRNKMTKL